MGAGRGIPSNFKRAKEERYAFDRVFDENATQEEVFANTTKHLIDGVLKGFNASVFAYGATGTPLLFHKTAIVGLVGLRCFPFRFACVRELIAVDR